MNEFQSQAALAVDNLRWELHLAEECNGEGCHRVCKTGDHIWAGLMMFYQPASGWGMFPARHHYLAVRQDVDDMIVYVAYPDASIAGYQYRQEDPAPWLVWEVKSDSERKDALALIGEQILVATNRLPSRGFASCACPLCPEHAGDKEIRND